MREHLRMFNPSVGLGYARGIVFLDDCEGTFNWVESGTGGDDVHEYNTASAFSGTNGLKMMTRTTGAAANDYLVLVRYVPLLEPGVNVLRCKVRCPDVSAVKIVRMQALFMNGTRGFTAGLKWTPNTPIVEVRTGLVSYVEVSGLDIGIVDNAWTEMELSWEMVTGKYIDAVVHGKRVDISTVGCYDAAANTQRWGKVELLVQSIGAAPAEVDFDWMYQGGFLEL